MNFLRFLACTFYWMRFELVTLMQPNVLPCSLIRERGRWRVLFGEKSGEGREPWSAIRNLLEGRPDTDAVEFTEEALEQAARELDERKARELQRQADERAAHKAREDELALHKARVDAEDDERRASERANQDPPAAPRALSAMERAHELERANAAAAAAPAPGSRGGMELPRSQGGLAIHSAADLPREGDPLPSSIVVRSADEFRDVPVSEEPDELPPAEDIDAARQERPRRGFFGKRKGF